MEIKEIIIATSIHLLLPLGSLLLYWRLLKKMSREQIEAPPQIELFFIFAHYGAWLVVLATSLFWYWSGLASLGSFYLILVGPIVMGMVAYQSRTKQQQSLFHLWTFRLALFYPLIIILMVLISGLFMFTCKGMI